MNNPDLGRAKAYVFERLESDLSADLVYHNIHHTRDEVLPAATRFAKMEGLKGDALLLLQTAALFHDIGFLETYTGHEVVGARIATQILPEFGYSPTQIETIANIILATQMPQSPSNHLEQLICDADLGVLGQRTFLRRNLDLRTELRNYGTPINRGEWYANQVDFLETHSYFTLSAQQACQSCKQHNLEVIKRLLRSCRK